jgi:hypothetical protein
MDRADSVAALTALAGRLDAEGIHGEMYVVGGAAIALAYAPSLVASPRMVLALKVLAHRVGEDDDDVRLLAEMLELGTAAEVLDVAESVFGDRLDVAARFFVEEIFAS